MTRWLLGTWAWIHSPSKGSLVLPGLEASASAKTRPLRPTGVELPSGAWRFAEQETSKLMREYPPVGVRSARRSFLSLPSQVLSPL